MPVAFIRAIIILHTYAQQSANILPIVFVTLPHFQARLPRLLAVEFAENAVSFFLESVPAQMI